MKVDLGSGYAPHEPWNTEWVHVDTNPRVPHVDYVADVAGPLPFADGEVDELRAADILEHVPYRQALDALREWARVLRPGGRLFVRTPDAGTIMSLYLTAPTSLVEAEFVGLPPIVSAAWRILGGHDDGRSARDGDDWRQANVHLSLWDEPSIRWYLNEAGFHVDRLLVNGFPNLCVWARRLAT